MASRGQSKFGMLLASVLKVMLLDEPTSGTSRDEPLDMIAILRGLRKGSTIVLLERDADAVFELADRISVLVTGNIVASSLPDGVRNNETERTSCLGYEDLA